MFPQHSRFLWVLLVCLLLETLLVCRLTDAKNFNKWLPITQNDIYCKGPLLRAVQNAEIFNDSKQFVDMPMRHSAAVTLEAFQRLMLVNSDRHNLSNFVGEMFDPPREELEIANLTDWTPNPPILSTISDVNYQHWARNLNEIWKKLGRQVKKEVQSQPERFSLIYVPHPFVIPGGRFREIYYWDSYWIIKGLLACGMHETSKGMILNLAYLVEKFGMIPNGNRIYYLNRSQPPLFIPMVKDYYDATKDIQFVKSQLPSMEKEFQFWLKNRQFTLQRPNQTAVNYFRHKVNSSDPRPESYREDEHTAEHAKDQMAKQQIWSEIAAAAESGWDFSSRWLNDSLELESCRTSAIVPVDLNAFMALSARSLQQLFTAVGDTANAKLYEWHYNMIKQQIYQINWNETDGIWYDYDLETHRHVNRFYISNVVPLVANCQMNDSHPKRVYDYLNRSGALDRFPLGIPTSFIDSGQQWDYVNAWPPNVQLLIEGLRLTGQRRLVRAARRIASQWIRTNYEGYLTSHAMFEKYDISNSTNYGGTGGEYSVQTGFGWTNGVVLDIFTKFPNITYKFEMSEQDVLWFP